MNEKYLLYIHFQWTLISFISIVKFEIFLPIFSVAISYELTTTERTTSVLCTCTTESRKRIVKSNHKMTSSSSSSSSTMLKTLLPFCENVQCNDLHSTEKPQEKCICIDIKSSPVSPTTSHDYHYIGYPVDPTITTTTTTTEVSLQNLSAAPASFIVSRQSPQPQHDISLNRSAAASSSSSAAEKENNDNMQIFNNGMNVAATTSSSVAGVTSSLQLTSGPGEFLPAASTTHVASVTVHNNQQQAISHPQNQPSMHHHNNHQQHPSIDDNNAIDISPSYPCSCGRPVEKDSNIVSGDEDNVITAQRKGHHL